MKVQPSVTCVASWGGIVHLEAFGDPVIVLRGAWAVPRVDCLIDTLRTPNASCMRRGTHLLVPCLEEEELALHRRWLDMSEALPCPGKETPTPGCRLGALYWACVHNDPTQLQAILDGGVSPEEATQVDSNGRATCLW
ncbi:ANKRD33 isoform 6, partial [Pan troglodytes]